MKLTKEVEHILYYLESFEDSLREQRSKLQGDKKDKNFGAIRAVWETRNWIISEFTKVKK